MIVTQLDHKAVDLTQNLYEKYKFYHIVKYKLNSNLIIELLFLYCFYLHILSKSL